MPDLIAMMEVKLRAAAEHPNPQQIELRPANSVHEERAGYFNQSNRANVGRAVSSRVRKNRNREAVRRGPQMH